jgi:trigger factor
MVDMQRNQLLQAQIQLEDYLKYINKTEQDFRKELEPMAIKKVRGGLVLAKVAEAESIKITEKEIDAEADRMAPEDENDRKRFMKALADPIARQSIMRTLSAKKTLLRLVDLATAVDDQPNTMKSAKAEKGVKDAA